MWTDGSKSIVALLDMLSCGWKGVKIHMGYDWESYGAECATIARGLETTTIKGKRHKLGSVTIFTDAQAAIWRISIFGRSRASTDLCYPDEKTFGGSMTNGTQVEIRWRPSHKGIAGNEMADQEAKMAAKEPKGCGVEWRH